MKVKELLAKREAWTQGMSARNAAGEYAEPADDSAVCFCLVGAVIRCYPKVHEGVLACFALNRVIRGRGDPVVSLTEFNDTHDYADVLSVVEEAGV